MAVAFMATKKILNYFSDSPYKKTLEKYATTASAYWDSIKVNWLLHVDALKPKIMKSLFSDVHFTHQKQPKLHMRTL